MIDSLPNQLDAGGAYCLNLGIQYAGNNLTGAYSETTENFVGYFRDEEYRTECFS